MVGDTSTSQLGQQGSTGNDATGERTENGNRTADSAGSVESDSGQSGNKVTNFDEPFGLKPVREISSVEDIDENIDKIIQGLRQHEGDGTFKSFEGFAYQGAYKKNAGHQVIGYLVELKNHIPFDILKSWFERHNTTNADDIRAYGEKLYSSVSNKKNSQTNNKLGKKSAVSVQEQVHAAEADVNTNPTDKQKETKRHRFTEDDYKAEDALNKKYAKELSFLTSLYNNDDIEESEFDRNIEELQDKLPNGFTIAVKDNKLAILLDEYAYIDDLSRFRSASDVAPIETEQKQEKQKKSKKKGTTKTDNELTKLGVNVKEERTDDDNVRFEKTNGQDAVSQEEAALRDALIDKVREAGIDVITDTEEGQRVLDEANSGVRLQARLDTLNRAAMTIQNWIDKGVRGKIFTIELPMSVQKMIRRAMGRDFDSHNITANGIAHAMKNHGVGGRKLNSNSIPLRQEDLSLIPYIMTAPDRVEKSSVDATGRESVRFYKDLSNGYVVVVEKEYKNSPDDMETITMWAEMSDKATNARQNTAPDTHVQNAILDIDAAKIRKDAENAIRNDEKLREQKVSRDAVEARDKEYLEAVERGDIDKAQQMVEEAAKSKGYNSNSDYQGTSAFNGKAPYGNGYFLSKEERKEAWENKEFEGESSLGDYIDNGIDGGNIEYFTSNQNFNHTDDMRREAIENLRNIINGRKRTITMYRSVPSDVKEGSFRNGDWVTPSLSYAIENARIHGWGDNFRIIKQEVSIDDVWFDGNDIAEWGYGREEDFINDTDFSYKNTKNNRKLLDAVTYDDNGNVIPLSERFNESKSDIRFFRTSDGHAYGFTVGGKIYIDQRIATADTPIHEYAHLWASAMRKLNPNEWENIVELMKGTPVWEEVKRNYPELTNDDDIADEVLAFYSGSRGVERLREEQKRITNSNGKEAAVNAINRVKEALKRFWKNVAEWFNVHFTTAEEVADKVLSDLLNGVNPTLAGVENDIRFADNSEEAEIVARAKADGTYMKAPNGKQSNLSPSQWVQVRTKAFKDWFGDWEKVARIEKLRNTNPIEITGNEITPSQDLKEYKKNALEYGKSLRGEYINDDTNTKIEVNAQSIKEVLQHDYKDKEQLQSIAAIPQIIKNGIFIVSLPNEDVKRNVNVKEYQYYVCGLRIGNVDYTVKSVIAIDNNGNRYYDHKLTEIEKGKLLDELDRITNPSSQENSTLSRYKDTRLFSILQINSSKVVDENGEPLVVYHGTTNYETKQKWNEKLKSYDTENKQFTIFRRNTDGERNYGMFFNSDMDNAFAYGYYTYSVYLNIKNPLEIDCNNSSYDAIRYNGEVKDTYEWAKWAEKNGYDGVIFRNIRDGVDFNSMNEPTNDYVTFASNQIKSATDNIGTFDRRNPDIRYSKSENISNTDEDDDTLYRSDDTMYRIREEAAPINTGIGYKVFVLKNGELYPPMVANPNGDATPVGVWLDADAAPIAGQSKTGRSQVKAGGKGTHGGSGKLAYRPGWHLGKIPYALQFNRNDENGERTLFPANFVWAEVEYANDVDYQEEAMSYGYNKNGKFQHSYAGLPRVPENGAYTYRTNPNPETDPWIITGAMRVKRLLTPTEVDEMVKAAGREPQQRQEGAVTDAEIEALNAEFVENYRVVNELDQVNDRFNKELATLTDENADNKVLMLGTPSDILLLGGVENKPMKLYGNKVIKKMHKHGFTLSELNDLPKAVANPIAIFDGSINGSHAILTELKIGKNNILVSLSIGKNNDVDFNIVSSVYGKANKGVVNWINDGKLRYVSKKKMLDYLRISAPIAEAQSSQALSDAAKIVKDFENPSVDEENSNREVREAERNRMSERVASLAEKLHLDNVEIVTDVSTLEGKKQRAKGFYSKSTGKITIVIPNHVSTFDAEQTLLHEAVAHYGLRQLFGEHFDTFLDNVFNNADESIRKRISELAIKKYKFDFRKATEEYLATLAENTDFEAAQKTGWWQKIKDFFMNMLHKIGFEDIYHELDREAQQRLQESNANANSYA